MKSPTYRLLAGLAITLLAVGIYSAYTILQLRALSQLQTATIDRDRTDTLLLLRIQNGLNALALTMRDMLDEQEPYPLTAWAPQFRRIRADLEDALAREEKTSVAGRTPEQRQYLAESFPQFWDALDRIFDQAGDQAGSSDLVEARTRIRLSLQARQAALSTAVARMLVQNNASEEAAAQRTRELYSGVQRNVYIFLAAMLVVIVLTSLYLVQYIRRLFAAMDALSQRRSELAQQLISVQETVFRDISRDLHDDFGQILTAIGAMLKQEDRRTGGLLEVREIVQETLEKVRALSHALHPVVLDEIGFESALEAWLPGFEKQTGIEVDYTKTGQSRELEREVSTHLYRVLQEAMNNVAKHSGSKRAAIRLRFEAHAVILEIQDEGVGFGRQDRHGLGLVSMRERAEMMNGQIEFPPVDKGALVRVTLHV
jgi:signal transduction histidine kinase